MSIFGLTVQDLINATSVDNVNACLDDGNTGVPNAIYGAAIIDRGEQEVLSWLVNDFGPPPIPADVLAQLAADPFLKYAALEYSVAHMFDRHPEYVRSGMKDREARFKRADDRMERIMNARQRPPTVTAAPANVGGYATGADVDNSGIGTHRIMGSRGPY